METASDTPLNLQFPDAKFNGIVFAPDGKSIYCSGKGKTDSVNSLYQISLAGGKPIKILENIFGTVTFTPDGGKIAFIRQYPELNEYVIILADANGANERKLVSRARPNQFNGSPVWSPDGRKIACPAGSADGSFHFEVLAVDAVDGSVSKITDYNWTWVGSLAWMPDSDGLIINAQDENSTNSQVWQIGYSSGERRKITNDSFVYDNLSMSSDARTLTTLKRKHISHVWVTDVEKSGEAAQITTGFDKYDGTSGLAWTPDGRILYHSRASGADAIWTMDAEGKNQKQLTVDTGAGFAVLPDGNFLVFQNKTAGDVGLWLMNFTDGSLRQLTAKSSDMTPAFSPDGKWIYYSRFTERNSLSKISIDGGEPQMVFDEYRTIMSPTVAPDAKSIAFAFSRKQSGSSQTGIAILSSENHQVIKTFGAEFLFGTIYQRSTLQWTHDGNAVNYVNYANSVSNIRRLSIVDGQISEVTNFKDGRIFNFAFSLDGKRLAIARGTVNTDVVLLNHQE